MKKVIMMMAVAMMTACSNKVDNALNNESAASPIDETKPLRLAVAGVTHGHVGEVAGRVGRGDFEVVDDRRGGKVVIELLGRINKCGVISPRFDIGVDGYEKAVSNLLPSRQFGYIVLTTNIGIIDQDRARRKHVGGKLLGFFY